jgi:hypothetical protein
LHSELAGAALSGNAGLKEVVPMTAVRIDHPKLDRVSRRWGQIGQTLPPESDAEREAAELVVGAQLGLQRLGPPGPIEIWGCPATPGALLGEKMLKDRMTTGHEVQEKWSLREIFDQSTARFEQPASEVDEERGPPHCPMRWE